MRDRAYRKHFIKLTVASLFLISIFAVSTVQAQQSDSQFDVGGQLLIIERARFMPIAPLTLRLDQTHDHLTSTAIWVFRVRSKTTRQINQPAVLLVKTAG